MFLELPDKFRRNESLSLGPGGPGIDRVEVLNGNDVWDENSGGGGRFGRGGDFGGGGRGGDFGGFAARRGRRSADRRRRSRAAGRASIPSGSRNCSGASGRRKWRVCCSRILLTTDSPVAWIGTAQSPDGTADVLEVKIAGRRGDAALPRLDDAHAADDDVERRRRSVAGAVGKAAAVARGRWRCARRRASGRCRTGARPGWRRRRCARCARHAPAARR